MVVGSLGKWLVVDWLVSRWAVGRSTVVLIKPFFP